MAIWRGVSRTNSAAVAENAAPGTSPAWLNCDMLPIRTSVTTQSSASAMTIWLARKAIHGPSFPSLGMQGLVEIFVDVPGRMFTSELTGRNVDTLAPDSRPGAVADPDSSHVRTGDDPGPT